VAKVLRICAFFILGFLILLIILSLFVCSSPGENWIRKTVQKQLSQMFEVPVSIGRLKTNLISWLKIEDLRISQAGEQSILYLKSAHVRYNAFRLLLKSLNLKSIDLDSLNLSIERDSSGRFTFDYLNDLLAPDTTASPLSISLQQVSMKRSFIQYNDLSIPLNGQLNRTSLDLCQTADSTYQIQLNTGRSDFTFDLIPIEFDYIQASVELKNGNVSLAEIYMTAADLKFSSTLSTALPALNASINISGNPHLFLKRLLPDLFATLAPLEGDIETRITAIGDLPLPEINIYSTISKMTIAGIELTEGKLDVSYKSDSLIVRQIRARISDGSITASALVLNDSLLHHSAEIKIANLNLQPIWMAAFSNPLLRHGHLDASILTEGTLRNISSLSSSGDITLSQLTLVDKNVHDILLSFKLQNSQLFAEFHSDLNRGNVTANLLNNQVTGQYLLDIHNIEPLAQLANIADASGKISVKGSISGSYENPKIETSLSVYNLLYQNFPVDELTAELFYLKKEITINMCHFRGELAEVSSAAPFYLDQLAGTYSYQGDFQGVVPNLTGTLKVKMFQPGYSGYRFDSGQLLVEFQNDIVNLTDLSLNKSSWQFHSDGSFSISEMKAQAAIRLRSLDPNSLDFGLITGSADLQNLKTVIINLNGAMIDLNRFHSITPEFPNLMGYLDFQMTFTGNLDKPEIRLQPVIRNFNFKHLKYDNISADIQFNENQLTIEQLLLIKPDEEIHLAASIPITKRSRRFAIDKSSNINGIINASNIDLDQFNPLIPSDLYIQGKSNLGIAITGTINKPIWNGTISVKNGKIQWAVEQNHLTDVNININLRKDEIHVEELSGSYSNIPFFIQSTFTTRDWKRFKNSSLVRINNNKIMIVKGSFDQKAADLKADFEDVHLADFTTLLPAIYALQGSVNGEINLSGSWQNPDITGQIKIEKGYLQVSSNSPPVKNLTLRASYRNSRLELEKLSGLVHEMPFTASGNLDFENQSEFAGTLRLNIKDRETLRTTAKIQRGQINVNLAVDQFDLSLMQSFTSEGFITRGYLSSQINVSGTPAKPGLKGYIGLTDGFLQMSENSPPLEQLQLQIVLQDTILEFQQFSGILQNSPFTIEGRLKCFDWQRFQIGSTFNLANQKIVNINGLFGRDTLDIQLTIDSLDLSLAKAFTQNIHDIQGQLISNLMVTGKPLKPHITGNFNILNASIEIDTSYPGIESINLSSSFQDTFFTLHSLNAQVRGIPIQSHGTISTRHFENYHVNLDIALYNTDFARTDLLLTPSNINGFAEINNLDLNHFQPLLKSIERLNGKMNASLNISGNINSPQFSANANISGGLLQMRHIPHPIDSIEASITASDTLFQIDALSASVGGLPVQISGKISNWQTRHYRLDLEMKSRDQKILNADGIFEPKYNDLTVAISEFDLAVLKPFTPLYRLEGQLNSAVQITGTPANPRFNGTIQLNQGLLQTDFRQPPIDNLNIDGQMVDNDFRINRLLGRYQSNEFNIAGNINLEERRTVAAQLTFYLNNRPITTLTGYVDPHKIDTRLVINNLDISSFKDFQPDIYQLSGLLNASLNLTGVPERPKIGGEITFQNGEFQLNPETPAISSISLKTAFQDTLANVEYCRAIVQNTSLELNGRLASRDWQSFSSNLNILVNNGLVVAARGYFDPENIQMQLQMLDLKISYFQPFITEFKKINGDISSLIEISGPISKPHINGSARINGLCFQPRMIDEVFTDGIISLRFEQTRFYLDTLALQLNKGTIQSSGYFAYRRNDISDLELNTTMKNISINRKKQYQVALKSSTLRLWRQNNFYNLDGDVVFDETRLQYNVQPKTLISIVQSSRRPSGEPLPLMQKIRLNVRIRDSKNIWIDNNLARVRLRPEIGIIGTAAKTNISGRLKIEEGYILYLDRKFKVKQGIIDFIDPNTINPIIDFTAESEIKSYQTLSQKAYTVTIIISGPLDEVVFDLQSQPSLDKSDIIALLTFGATREELVGRDTDSRGGVGTAIQERLTEYSSQRISSFTSAKVGTLLGLEEMSLEGNLFNFGKTWGPQLLASKKLSERMSVTYSTTVGHMNDQNVRLDYKLNEKFSLEGQTDQRGRAGMDLKYKLKFK